MRLKYLFLLGISSICCGQKKVTRQQECVELNMKAVQSLQDYLKVRADSSSLSRSLRFYNEAISCDSINLINYHGKQTVLILLHRYEESLGLLDKIYSLTHEKDQKILASKALIYEKLGKDDSAKTVLNQAFIKVERQLAQHPLDSIRVICDRLYLIAIVNGKERAIEELDKYLLRYPNNSSLNDFKLVLRDFDKKTILSD